MGPRGHHDSGGNAAPFLHASIFSWLVVCSGENGADTAWGSSMHRLWRPDFSPAPQPATLPQAVLLKRSLNPEEEGDPTVSGTPHTGGPGGSGGPVGPLDPNGSSTGKSLRQSLGPSGDPGLPHAPTESSVSLNVRCARLRDTFPSLPPAVEYLRRMLFVSHLSPVPSDDPLRTTPPLAHPQVHTIGESDAFGEVAFIFDVPQPFSVISLQPSRVLVLNKEAWRRVVDADHISNMTSVEETVERHWAERREAAIADEDTHGDVLAAYEETLKWVATERSEKNLVRRSAFPQHLQHRLRLGVACWHGPRWAVSGGGGRTASGESGRHSNVSFRPAQVVVGKLCSAAEAGDVTLIKRILSSGHGACRATVLHFPASSAQFSSA